MADSYVQVATDGSGKKIDNAALTREPETQGGTGDTVYRQRVVLGSDENPRQQVRVDGEVGDVALKVESASIGETNALLMEIRDLLRMVIGA
jgi:hypothetical protein